MILTSAGDPAHWSYKILEAALQEQGWRIHEVPGPCPWISDEDLAEQERLLPEWEYRRLHLNQWLAADDRLTNLDDIRTCITLDGPQLARPGIRYVIGLDIGLKHDRTVATVCHREENTVVVDRQETWQGTSKNPVRLETVEDWLLEASRTYRRAPIVFDPWQAVHLAQRLRSRHVRLIEFPFSASSVGRLAVTLHRLLKDHQLALYEDDALIDELANVRLEETAPGSYRIQHDSGHHDDRVISLALAVQHLISKPRKRTDMTGIDLTSDLRKPHPSVGRSLIREFDYR